MESLNLHSVRRAVRHPARPGHCTGLRRVFHGCSSTHFSHNLANPARHRLGNPRNLVGRPDPRRSCRCGFQVHLTAYGVGFLGGFALCVWVLFRRWRMARVMKEQDDDHWFWGKQMIACLDDLKVELDRHQPPVVDREIMPALDGTPDDMFVWFICEKAMDVETLKTAESPLKSLLKDRMKERGFPGSSISSLRVGSTSLEDIENGGGRFYFFR